MYVFAAGGLSLSNWFRLVRTGIVVTRVLVQGACHPWRCHGSRFRQDERQKCTVLLTTQSNKQINPLILSIATR
ncbi:hypothetical protein BZA77DRAFT_330188, partial [Pyronema omphalodes]